MSHIVYAHPILVRQHGARLLLYLWPCCCCIIGPLRYRHRADQYRPRLSRDSRSRMLQYNYGLLIVNPTAL